MKKVLLCLLVFTALFFSKITFAQSGILINAIGYNGMGQSNTPFDGGSTVKGYEKQIEAMAYSDGLAGCTIIPHSGSGSVGCKVSENPFMISIPLSFAVNSFRYNLLNGRLINSIDMTLLRGGGAEGFAYYKVHMENVEVSSISEGASKTYATINPVTTNGDLLFNIELVPQKIAWQIIQQGNDGSPGNTLVSSDKNKFSYGWDFATNRSYDYHF